MSIDLIKNIAIDVLKHISTKGFSMSSNVRHFVCYVKRQPSNRCKLKTGNLIYNNDYVFKQDFTIKGVENNFKEWCGHAWVEVDSVVWDLAFCRTLYSEKFIKPYKQELIQAIGEGRGLLAGEKQVLFQEYRLYYDGVDVLEDDMATAIIKGMVFLI